ncbi:MAG: RidA family protein [Rhodoferax sp.]
MSRQIAFRPKAGKPPPVHSQAVKAAGLVFVSGAAPTDPVTGAIRGATIQEQTRHCLSNIRAILEEAGSSLDKIVSATAVPAEEDDFAGMNEEWLRWFPSNPPARQGAKLPVRVPGLKVSIAVIAEACSSIWPDFQTLPRCIARHSPQTECLGEKVFGGRTWSDTHTGGLRGIASTGGLGIVARMVIYRLAETTMVKRQLEPSMQRAGCAGKKLGTGTACLTVDSSSFGK